MKSLIIFKREVGHYFLSPMAYIVIGFFLLLSGYFFSTFILSSRIVTMQVTLGNMSLLFIFVVPILTMHLIADERKLGTEELLLTSPVTTTSVVIGKYLASLFFNYSLCFSSH